MARKSWTKEVVGKASCEIALTDHQFIQSHAYPGEPIYATVNRIIMGYKNSEFGQLAEENKNLKNAMNGYLERARYAEAELQKFREKENKVLEVFMKPVSETTKLRNFSDIINALSGVYNNSIPRDRLIPELVNTQMFTQDEAEEFIKKALSNGQIYESNTDVYSRP